MAFSLNTRSCSLTGLTLDPRVHLLPGRTKLLGTTTHMAAATAGMAEQLEDGRCNSLAGSRQVETGRRGGEGRRGEEAHRRGDRMSGEHQYMEKTIKT